MNLVELVAKIGLDTTEYESGLSKVGSAFGTVAKVGATALAGATTAVTAFAKSAVDAGMGFDTSMSQVEATMGENAHKMIEYNGETIDSMVALRDFAQEMGASTAFSASQASDGLNVLAMAGFDATQQMEALPSVLALASAGGLELAESADFVTGIMAGFGKTTQEDTEHIADLLATMSASAKGSVSDFGAGLSTVAGMAKTTGQEMDSMAVALEILGNNNVSASEGGNALSRVLKNLYQATDTAQAGLDELGISAYTATGEAKPLQDVLQELSVATADMTDEAKNQALSQIFDSATLKSVPFLLDNCTESWDKLATGISKADGSAQTMASTQIDNLAGDVTLFQSALEGVQIAVSDGLTPALRDFVKIGTDGLSNVASALQNGDIDGAFGALGDALGVALNKVTEMLPQAVDAGVELLRALGNGIMQNLPMIVDSAKEIVLSLVEMIIEFAPDILDAGIEILLLLAEGMSEAYPELIPAIIDAILQMVDALIQNAPLLLEGAIALVTGLAEGLIESLPIIIDKLPEMIQNLIDAMITCMPMLIDANVQLVTMLVQHMPEIIAGLIEAIPEIVTSIVEGYIGMAQAFLPIGETFIQIIAEGMSNAGQWIQQAIDNIKQWFDDLPVKIAYALGVAVRHFVDWVVQTKAKAEEIKTNIIQAIITWFTELPSKLWTALLTTINRFQEFISNLRNKVVTGIPSLISRFVSYWTELPSKMADIGRNVIQGLWNGISDKFEGLLNDLRDKISKIKEAFTSGFDTHSPSRWFKWLGEMNVEGFKIGMDELLNPQKILSDITDTMNSIGTMDIATSATVGAGASGVGVYNQTVNINQRIATPDELARQLRLEARYGLMRGVTVG